MEAIKLNEFEEEEFKVDPEGDMLLNVDRGLAKIREHEAEIKRYEDYLAETKAFVERKKLEYNARIDNIKPQLMIVLQELDKKTIDVVNGTIKRRKLEKWYYPEDLDKLQFARDNCPDIIIEKVVYNASLTDIKKHIKSTGEIPEGFDVQDEESFSYNLRGEK